jgi:ribonucleoside-triphosphate reductase
MNFTYGDCQPERDIINKAFIKIMLGGDADAADSSIPYPPTPSPDFDWSDPENNRLLFE